MPFKSKEENSRYNRIWHLNNRLSINGSYVRVRKRKFYGFCELCGLRIKRQPCWHHWDDSRPELGIWVHVGKCHRICEAFEHIPLGLLYLQIKELIVDGNLIHTDPIKYGKYGKTKEGIRLHHLENRLWINGKMKTVRKRTFYGLCELCGKSIENRPNWHHWDDDHPERGIWVDIEKCHRICDGFEDLQRGLLYLKIKELLDEEYRSLIRRK